MELLFNQHRLHLLPAHAVYDAAAKTVYVADLHLGKTTAFHRAGIALPTGSDEDTLHRLNELILSTQAQTLVMLGDVFHSTARGTQSAAESLNACRARHRQIRWIIVPGNHDRRVPWEKWLAEFFLLTEGAAVGPWCVAHHPPKHAQTLTLCGHLHPSTAVGRSGSRKITLPCFWMRRQVLVLPAFGTFTGMHRIEREEGDRVFVPLNGQVYEIPASGANKKSSTS